MTECILDGRWHNSVHRNDGSYRKAQSHEMAFPANHNVVRSAIASIAVCHYQITPRPSESLEVPLQCVPWIFPLMVCIALASGHRKRSRGETFLRVFIRHGVKDGQSNAAESQHHQKSQYETFKDILDHERHRGRSLVRRPGKRR